MSFGYINTFFFISLAIVLLLILLLCYYLKNKIDQLGNQCSSFRDILGKLIREVKIQAVIQGSSNSTPKVTKLETLYEEDDEQLDIEYCGEEQVPDEGSVEDDDDDEEDEEGDNHIEYDEGEYEGEEYKDLDFEKVADLPLEKVSIDMNSATPSTLLSKEDYGSLLDLEDVLSTDEIVVHKIDELDEPVVLEDTVEKNDANIEEKMELYRKMNLHQLKQHVITNGLATQPNKMKKEELLKIIHDSF